MSLHELSPQPTEQVLHLRPTNPKINAFQLAVGVACLVYAVWTVTISGEPWSDLLTLGCAVIFGSYCVHLGLRGLIETVEFRRIDDGRSVEMVHHRLIGASTHQLLPLDEVTDVFFIDQSDADSNYVLMVIALRERQVTVIGTPMSEDLRAKARTIKRFLGAPTSTTGC